MKAISFLIATLLASPFVFAAPNVAGAKAQYDKLSSQYATDLANLQSTNNALAKLQEQLRQQERATSEAKRRMEGSRQEVARKGWFSDQWSVELGEPSVQEVKAYQAAIAEQERIRGEVNRKIGEVRTRNTALADLNAQVMDAKEDVQDVTAELNTQRAAFKANMKMWTLEQDFSRIKTDLLTNDEMIKEISSNFDKRVMGVYMRDKMQSLLASDAMCDYVKKTASTGQCQKPTASTLDKVFDGTKGRGTASGTPAAARTAGATQ